MRTVYSPILVTALTLALVAGQAEARPVKAAKPTNVTGVVQSVHAANKSFVLHTHQGWGKKAVEQDLTVTTTGGTTFKRAGKLRVTRKAAGFGDLASNEKVQVKGLPAKDGKIGATYVLIKSDGKK